MWESERLCFRNPIGNIYCIGRCVRESNEKDREVERKGEKETERGILCEGDRNWEGDRLRERKERNIEERERERESKCVRRGRERQSKREREIKKLRGYYKDINLEREREGDRERERAEERERISRFCCPSLGQRSEKLSKF